MLIYFSIVNIISFLTFGLDKRLAIKHKYRISEGILLTLTLVGGELGSILGMIIFHHKTRKIKFWVCVIISFAIWFYLIFKELGVGIL